MEQYTYITFRSVHEAMKAESALKTGGFAFQTVPVPREIRPDCGIALRLRRKVRNAVFEYMAKQGILYSAIVELESERKKMP